MVTERSKGGRVLVRRFARALTRSHNTVAGALCLVLLLDAIYVATSFEDIGRHEVVLEGAAPGVGRTIPREMPSLDITPSPDEARDQGPVPKRRKERKAEPTPRPQRKPTPPPTPAASDPPERQVSAAPNPRPTKKQPRPSTSSGDNRDDGNRDDRNRDDGNRDDGNDGNDGDGRRDRRRDDGDPQPKPDPRPKPKPSPKPPVETAWDPRNYNFDANTGRSNDATRLTRIDKNPYVVRESGTVLKNIQTVPEQKSVITVDGAADVRISECSLAHQVRVYDHNSTTASAIVERCDLAVGGNALAGLALTARYNRITSTNDGITPTGGAHGRRTVIEYNKIVRDGSRLESKHHDGIQFWQGGNALIRRNWISGWHTSAILMKSDLELQPGDGPVRNITIEENYLANPTGHYILYVRDGGRGRPRFITIRNNVFGPGGPISSGGTPSDQATFVRTVEERKKAIAAGNADAAEWIVWDGNISARTGKEINPPGGWHKP